MAAAKPGVVASLYPVRPDSDVGQVGMQPCRWAIWVVTFNTICCSSKCRLVVPGEARQRRLPRGDAALQRDNFIVCVCGLLYTQSPAAPPMFQGVPFNVGNGDSWTEEQVQIV